MALKKEILAVVLAAIIMLSVVAWTAPLKTTAQAINVRVLFFNEPLCPVCWRVQPLVVAACDKYAISLIIDDVRTPEGRGMAQAYGVSGVPTIIVSGAEVARFEGYATQAQIEAAIKAATGGPQLPTKVTLTASTITPAVNQKVTLAAKLYWWKAATNSYVPLANKPVTIWHVCYDGKVYYDLTKQTDAYGKITVVQKFGSNGPRWYSAAFVGDKVYCGSSSQVIIYVGTRLTLTASTTTPAVGQAVTFTATLMNGATPLSSKRVTIYHYLNGVRYTDTTKTTNAKGQITFIQYFRSPGTRIYYASFAGDRAHGSCQSDAVYIGAYY